MVVEHFIAAGRGLAAAHHEGLVHGDFKPDNVLVDSDGRVRVVDFGLASAADQKQSPPDSSQPPNSSSRLASNDLSIRLTPDGDFAGTPAYLAPEQFTGVHRSARSDQFSFCVSLYGERPFVGDTIRELRRSILMGPPPEPREGSAVPAWLRRILLRGLSGDPEQRYPNMDALLVALASDPNRRRWRIAAVVSVVILLIGAAASYRWMLVRELEQRQGLCAGAADELIGTWDSKRQQTAKQAFLKTNLSYAGDVWERVSSGLSTRADAWVAAHTQACRATHLSGGQSPALLDLRMACLQRRLTETRFLVDVFIDADAGVVENAVQAVEQLASLEACSDTVGLLAAKQPTRTDAEAATVEAIHEQLDRARAFERTARFKLGLDLATQALEDAQALADQPLLAEAMLVRGELLDLLGKPEASEALRQGFFTAQASGDEQLPVRLAI
ncbi:MAG: serine/threonine protein kinase, partial [Nannocystaceae bacterium]